MSTETTQELLLSAVLAENKKLVTERDGLKSQLAVESARLDWLQHNGTIEVQIDGLWKAFDHVTGRSGNGATIRAAIDATQAQEETRV